MNVQKAGIKSFWAYVERLACSFQFALGKIDLAVAAAAHMRSIKLI